MNYIRHLTGFFDRVAIDDRLNPTHISLYMSLFQFWNINRFVNPISISRSEMMSISKIHSKATYHKVIKDLSAFGFIHYEPSYNPFRGSAVHLVNFEEDQEVSRNHSKTRTSNEPAVYSSHTENQAGTVLLNEPYTNSINTLNNKHGKQQAPESASSIFGESTDSSTVPSAEASAKAEPSEKAERVQPPATGNRKPETNIAAPLPTSLDEVKAFFATQKSTTIEAEKFFNHFQSNGWKVGGRAPMKDWKAAARNWILNETKFNTRKQTPDKLHSNADKDYGEAL
jgi:hypothetical protein